MARALRVWFGLLGALLGLLVVAPGADAFVYWGHFAYGHGVGRAALDGTGVNDSFVAAPAGSYAFSRGVAVNGSHLFWGTHGEGTTPSQSFAVPRIGRSNLDGTGVAHTFTASTGQGLSGLAVSASHIYWSSNNQDTSGVGRTPIIGGQQFQAIESVFGEPNPSTCGVATDDTYVYWANRNTWSIGRAELANYGTAQQVVEGNWLQLSPPGTTVSPCGVAVDADHVYWGVHETRTGANQAVAGSTIGRANKDGTGAVNNFLGGGNRVTGLALDGAFLYWTNYGTGAPGTGSIGRGNVAGNGWDPSLVGGLDAPWGVAAESGGPSAPPPISNPAYLPSPPPLSVYQPGGGANRPAPLGPPPDFSRVWPTHKVFAPAAWNTPLSVGKSAARVPRGTALNFIVNRAGVVRIAINRVAAGRKAGKRCKRPTRKLAGRPRCERLIKIWTLTRQAKVGRNTVAFSGRVKGKALTPGRYKAVFTGQSGKRSSQAKSLAFRVVR